ncbi:MAG: pyridoxine 5'-phosphate synthase [Planctomycetota bacterium]|nr:pyridoxine 5'-phosphate synthase [Planctomycetota bacterium]
MPRLHVNVDHVATLRQARREAFPDPVEWALRVERAGAQGITCHLRKDRRHIQDADVANLRRSIRTLLNLECSLDPEMVTFALRSGAEAFCLVPETRQEVTTEGGLDVRGELERVKRVTAELAAEGGAVSLFIDADREQIAAAADSGAPFIELHTGCYANAKGDARARELERLVAGAAFARERGLRVNAGHGLDYSNVGPVAAIEGVEELNIGFAIVAHAVFVGVDAAIVQMLDAMRAGRSKA